MRIRRLYFGVFFFSFFIVPRIFCQIPSGSFLWLRSDTGIVAKGGRVLSWEDPASGFLFSQSDTNHLPFFVSNGIEKFPLIRFQGYHYLEGPPIFPAKHDYTVSAVVTITDTTGYNNIFSGDQHAFWLPNNTYPAVVHSAHFQTMAVSRQGIRPGPNIITVRYSEETQQAVLYVNGLFGDSLFCDTNLDSVCYIGSYERGYFLQGDIAELLLYRRECTEPERKQFEQYFFSKYGLSRPVPLPLPDTTFTRLPQNLQLYPRRENDSAVVEITGGLHVPGFDSIYCIVSKNNNPVERTVHPLHYQAGSASFSFAPSIHAEESEYSFRVGIFSASKDSVLSVRDSVVCGDVFLIEGQSNAIFGYGDPLLQRGNEFCRTFGQIYSKNIRDTQWEIASANYYGDAPTTVSGWGLRLQKRILEEQKIPTCIINGGYSGTIIEYHEPDSSLIGPVDRNDLRSIYGRMFYRAKKSDLAKFAKALFWLQGELYSTVETYYPLFKQLYNNWRIDYPNLQKIYVEQLRPSYCANIPIVVLRDLQRTLEDSLKNIEVFTITAMPDHDGCHFHDSGWISFGDRIYDLIAGQFYRGIDTIGIHSPHIVKAYFSTPNRDEIKILFRPANSGITVTPDTNVSGVDAKITNSFYLEDSVKVSAIKTSFDTLTLTLENRSLSPTISYIPERYYDNTQVTYEGPWLVSGRGMGALIFYHYPLADWKNAVAIDHDHNSLDVSPNPTERGALINYFLSNESPIDLSLYNILGQKVRILLQQNERSGNHAFLLDVSSLPDGEYYIHLIAGGSILNKKIIIMK